MKTPKRWHVIGLSYAAAVVLFIGSYMLTRWVQTLRAPDAVATKTTQS